MQVENGRTYNNYKGNSGLVGGEDYVVQINKSWIDQKKPTCQNLIYHCLETD